MFAGAHEAGLFSFFHSGVSGHETFFAQSGFELRINGDKSPRNGQNNSSQLAGFSRAGNNQGGDEAVGSVGCAIDLRIGGFRNGVGGGVGYG